MTLLKLKYQKKIKNKLITKIMINIKKYLIPLKRKNIIQKFLTILWGILLLRANVYYAKK